MNLSAHSEHEHTRVETYKKSKNRKYKFETKTIWNQSSTNAERKKNKMRDLCGIHTKCVKKTAFGIEIWVEADKNWIFYDMCANINGVKH